MKLARWIPTVLAALLLPALTGGLRMRENLARKPSSAVPAVDTSGVAARPHDPAKATIAIVAGADITEITDLLGPHEVFSRAGLYNVYVVAPTRASTALTGGLRIRPHYSLGELDTLLGGRAPQVIVAPNLPHVAAPANRPVVDWVRRGARKGALAFSWCAGAAVLAEAGLLDGRTATSHWGDLARLERDYPRVRWLRGVRWVDNGDIVTSAGITSGIDATLRLIARLAGEMTARRIAREMRYPDFHFALKPEAEQFRPGPADAVLFLNAGFRPIRPRIGVILYEGVGELDVSAVYDAHAAAGVADVFAVAASPGLVTTAHGLWLEPALVPGRDTRDLARLDRLLAPGPDARNRAGTFAEVLAGDIGIAPGFPHAASPERFGLEPVLEDLARTADRATAIFAQRRLEYRSDSLVLAGPGFPWTALAMPPLLAAAGALPAAFILRMVRRKRREAGPPPAPRAAMQPG